MVYQPILNKKAVSGQGIRYRLRYRNEFAEPGDPRHDESHIHNCFEIYFNLSGDVSFWANNRLYAIKSGDMIVTKPGDVHLCVYHKAKVHEHFCLWLDFGEATEAQNCLAPFFENSYYSLGEEKEHFASLFLRLRDQKEGEDSLLQTALLFELLALFAKKGNVPPSEPPDVVPQELQRIIDDLNENYAEIRHISEIMERYYVSQSTLNRWFRRYLHISPREFLEAKKLAYSKQLLSQGKTVTQACMLAGFSDCSYFISVFKKKFGETPLKFKNHPTD
jgi:AraC-like DNA-binding protein